MSIITFCSSARRSPWPLLALQASLFAIWAIAAWSSTIAFHSEINGIAIYIVIAIGSAAQGIATAQLCMILFWIIFGPSTPFLVRLLTGLHLFGVQLFAAWHLQFGHVALTPIWRFIALPAFAHGAYALYAIPLAGVVAIALSAWKSVGKWQLIRLGEPDRPPSMNSSFSVRDILLVTALLACDLAALRLLGVSLTDLGELIAAVIRSSAQLTLVIYDIVSFSIYAQLALVSIRAVLDKKFSRRALVVLAVWICVLTTFDTTLAVALFGPWGNVSDLIEGLFGGLCIGIAHAVMCSTIVVSALMLRNRRYRLRRGRKNWAIGSRSLEGVNTAEPIP